jgi:hypothetical protein
VIAVTSVATVTTGDGVAAAVPSPPRHVTVVAGPASVTVSWRAPGHRGSARVDRYRVVRSSRGAAKVAVTLGARRRDAVLAGLEPGLRYTVRVLAHNARGWSRSSAPATGKPLAAPGYGTVAGACRQVAPRLDDTAPSLVGTTTFDLGTDPYDDATDRASLTAGAQTVLTSPDGGGSAGLSRALAYEVLARCESADLLKTGDQIVYDQPGATTDLLVDVDGSKVGVAVVRGFGFPPGSPLPLDQAVALLDGRLDDVVESTAGVSPQDRWVKQVLVVMAYDAPTAAVIGTAWATLDGATRADTVVYVVTTEGADDTIYTG